MAFGYFALMAHEFGHGVGLRHAGHASPYLMQPLLLQPGDTELKQEDAKSYDEGP